MAGGRCSCDQAGRRECPDHPWGGAAAEGHRYLLQYFLQAVEYTKGHVRACACVFNYWVCVSDMSVARGSDECVDTSVDLAGE